MTPPAEEALSLVAAKEFLRVGHAGEDTLIGDLIGAATARLEKAASLALVTRTLRLTLDMWPVEMRTRGIKLRPGPVSAIVSVQVRGADGALSDVSARFMQQCGSLALKAWEQLPAVPTGGRIEVTFEAGFGAAPDVPEDLALALRRLVADGYRRGGEAGPGALPEDVVAILAARRELRI